MQQITIMQGLPGSGKSFSAAKIAAETSAEIVSADNFPGLYGDRDVDGRIPFNVALLGPAHGACFRAAVEALQNGRSVVVDNTNTTASEVGPYVLLAQAFGAAPKIVHVLCDPSTAHARNTHGVPYAVAKDSEGVRVFQTEQEFRSCRDRVLVVGGFLPMIDRLEGFDPEFHWQFVPGFERSEI